MQLSTVFLRAIVFAVAAVVAALAAGATVNVVEDRSVGAVQARLNEHGHEWASVLGDGLQVIIEGTAPSEATRFRSISLAGGVVDASRVIDNISVIDPAGMAPPEFSIEILRNDSGVSLIGLIPADTDREQLNSRIARIAKGQPVTDLLQGAEYPVPEDWPAAVNFAIRALGELPRSKISVSAGRVAITAISDSEAEKAKLEATLARQAPNGLRLAMSITAPRPVISPYLTRFTLDTDGARFDACVADTFEAASKITTAATAAGLEGKFECVLALGNPSSTWGEAVAMSIGAVKDLGGGTVTVSDTDIALAALEGTTQDTFDSVVGQLSNALPDAFALSATLPAVATATVQGPPSFSATLSQERKLQLRGRVSDALLNSTIESYAKARFANTDLSMGTRIVEGLPQGWTVRVLAGLEALSKLDYGSVNVTPDLITVTGETGNSDASAEISGMLVAKLGEAAKFDIDVKYVKALDPVAGLPTPEECLARIAEVTGDRKIQFDPGSTSISTASLPIVNDIAEALKNCIGLKLQILGYTDSQGREEMNQQLSQDRAQSVLAALRGRRLPTADFEAVGLGEADPIADNGTEEGREANRRIEFRLIGTAVEGAVLAPQLDPESEAAAPATPQDAPEVVPAEVVVEEPTGGSSDIGSEEEGSGD